MGKPTVLRYFTDTQLTSHTGAKVVSSTASEDGKKGTIVLDDTIFYPQGGGQPTDKGVVKADLWTLKVSSVSMVKGEGQVQLDGELEGQVPSTGDVVTQEVDATTRMLHARIHSAGHLLDAAVANAGLEGWQPAKGYHFADGPYVEYILGEGAKGVPPNMSDDNAKAEVVSKINVELKKLLSEGGQVAVSIKEKDSDAEIGTSDVSKLTADCQRSVNIGGIDCACGGTHVGEVKEIGSFEAVSIQKKKKNIMRVAYTMSE